MPESSEQQNSGRQEASFGRTDSNNEAEDEDDDNGSDEEEDAADVYSDFYRNAALRAMRGAER